MIDWRESHIGDEIELAYGKSLPARVREAGPFEVFGSNGCVGNHSAPLVSGPGIIVGRKGSVGQIAFSERDFWPIDTTYYVVNKRGHDWRFLFYLLSSLGLTDLNSHSAIPGLNRENVYSIPVYLPTKHEQHSIRMVLDAVENTVANEVLAIEKTQALKRAAMQTLFTHGLRGEVQKETEIGLIPENWELFPVTNIATVKGGKRMPKGISLTDENTGKPYIRVTDFQDHSVAVDQVLFIPKGYEDLIARYVISSDDIYISIAGTIGLVGQVPKSLDGANLTENAAKICLTDPNVDARFLMYALSSHACQTQILEATGRNAQPKLALNRIEQIKLPIPKNLNDQREVTSILDAIDHKIDLHQRKRAVLDDLFKALLHKLMMGEIRVGDLDLSSITDRTSEALSSTKKNVDTNEAYA